MTRTTGLFAAAVAALAATAMPAQAEQVQVGATTACKSALPAFDGNIRTRPLAMQNEGTANAFVSCAHANVSIATPDHDISVAAVFVDNQRPTAVNVSCTLVTDRLGAPNVYLPKTISVPANSLAQIRWTSTDDNGGNALSAFANFSCNLPPSVGLSRIAIIYPGST